ncbi:hypothetical protein AB0395_39995 [Streptosporangium sp. NPDC051023]|uniref:hypothetical protein n=1 Tax=Streptosporangium sp. NPDC051023 TaxID=3155410 RepID=UPI00344E6792
MSRTSARVAALALVGLLGFGSAPAALAAVPYAPAATRADDGCGRELGEWIDGERAAYRGSLRAESADGVVEATVTFEDDRVELTLGDHDSGLRRYRYNPDVPSIAWNALGFFAALDRPTCGEGAVTAADLVLRIHGTGRLEGQVRRVE